MAPFMFDKSMQHFYTKICIPFGIAIVCPYWHGNSFGNRIHTGIVKNMLCSIYVDL